MEQRLNGVSQTISANGGGVLRPCAPPGKQRDGLLALARQRLARLLREGVTTLEIKSGYGLDLANERKMLRVVQQLAATHTVEISPATLRPRRRRNIKATRTAISIWYAKSFCPRCGKRAIESVDAFCENVGFTPAQTERVYSTAQAWVSGKGHVEQLSSLGGAELVSRYKGPVRRPY